MDALPLKGSNGDEGMGNKIQTGIEHEMRVYMALVVGAG